jgi:hypothetical protein
MKVLKVIIPLSVSLVLMRNKDNSLVKTMKEYLAFRMCLLAQLLLEMAAILFGGPTHAHPWNEKQ